MEAQITRQTDGQMDSAILEISVCPGTRNANITALYHP